MNDSDRLQTVVAQFRKKVKHFLSQREVVFRHLMSRLNKNISSSFIIHSKFDSLFPKFYIKLFERFINSQY